MPGIAGIGTTRPIAAVVVTYNRLDLLRQCVEALRSQTEACDILVVNNASTDGTDRWLDEQQDVNSRNTGSNLGGAGGFNYGMRWAVETGYEYVWVMDDDTLPEPDALEKLLEADRILDGKYGWLSSVALWTDGSECKMNRQKLKGSFHEYSPLLRHGLIQAEQATFVSLFLRSDIVHRFGLPIKEYFIWGDDIEYTRRIAVRGGMPCFIAGQSQGVHIRKENRGSSISTDTSERMLRYRYAYRNEMALYRKEGVRGICYYIAKCGVNLWRILRYAPGNRFHRIQIMLEAMICGLFFNPKIEFAKEKNIATQTNKPGLSID